MSLLMGKAKHLPLYSSLSRQCVCGGGKSPPFFKNSFCIFLKVLKRLSEDFLFENFKSKNNSVLINEGE